MTMPDSWCNEVVWVRKSKGAVQCEKNTAPNAAQNKDPIENCVYRYRCVINPDTPSGCDYGNGYLGNDGYRPPALGKLEWFTLIPAGAPIKYSKEISDFWPVKELAWLAVNNGSCGRMCPMPSVQWFIKDYKVDCSWEAGGGAKRKEKGGLALDASRAFLKQ